MAVDRLHMSSYNKKGSHGCFFHIRRGGIVMPFKDPLVNIGGVSWFRKGAYNTFNTSRARSTSTRQ